MIFAVNSLLYLNQSVPPYGVALNSLTNGTTVFPLRKGHPRCPLSSRPPSSPHLSLSRSPFSLPCLSLPSLFPSLSSSSSFPSSFPFSSFSFSCFSFFSCSFSSSFFFTLCFSLSFGFCFSLSFAFFFSLSFSLSFFSFPFFFLSSFSPSFFLPSLPPSLSPLAPPLQFWGQAGDSQPPSPPRRAGGGEGDTGLRPGHLHLLRQDGHLAERRRDVSRGGAAMDGGAGVPAARGATVPAVSPLSPATS